MRCPACGTPNHPDRSLCGHCGRLLPDARPAPAPKVGVRRVSEIGQRVRAMGFRPSETGGPALPGRDPVIGGPRVEAPRPKAPSTPPPPSASQPRLTVDGTTEAHDLTERVELPAFVLDAASAPAIDLRLDRSPFRAPSYPPPRSRSEATESRPGLRMPSETTGSLSSVAPTLAMHPVEPTRAVAAPLQVPSVATRLGALALDGAWATALIAWATAPAALAAVPPHREPEAWILELAEPSVLFRFALASVSAALLMGLLESQWGWTPGKLVFGLRTHRTDGRPLGVRRSLARAGLGALGGLMLGAGFAWILVDRRCRAWHDLLTGTFVSQRGGRLRSASWNDRVSTAVG